MALGSTLVWPKYKNKTNKQNGKLAEELSFQEWETPQESASKLKLTFQTDYIIYNNSKPRQKHKTK